MHTPILDFLYIPIILGVQIRKGDNIMRALECWNPDVFLTTFRKTYWAVR